MTKVNLSYPDFSAGEVSPEMYGRFDLSAYYNGGRKVENFIPQVTGPAKYRTGTVYAAQTKSNNKAFLYVFEFTDTLSFVLEFTENTIRFYRNNGIVENSGSPVEVTSTYAAGDLSQLKFAQNGTDLYIVHPSYNPKKLTYNSPISWSFASHSPTSLTLSTDNYPSAVTFYEQRLIYGGSNNNPQTLYFSKSGDVDNFTTGTAVDDGIAYTVSGDGNTIKWLRGTDEFLAIGTFGDILKATGGIDDVITPESISIKPTNSFGVADINPIGKGSQIFYMQRNNLILRSLEYEFTQNAYFPADRNTIAEHITGDGITQLCFQEGRPNIVWAVRTDGKLIGMTVEDSESISGWHRHITDGEIVSVAPTARSSNYHQLWVCVKRTINGADKYYIEYFSDFAKFKRRHDYVTGDKAADDTVFANLMFEDQKHYIHLDSSLSYYGTSAGEDAGATVTPAAISGSSISFTAGASVFSSGDVGKQIWRKSVTGQETGRAEITSYTSATVVTCDIIEDFDSTSAMPAGEWYLTSDVFSGLGHLEGKTVSVVADGGQHPQAVVSSGSISLDRQASVVHAGLPYTGYLETNDLEGGGTTGPAQTKRKSVNAAGFRFLDTLYARYGVDYYSLEQIEMRTSSQAMDRPPLMFSGDTKETYANRINDTRDGGWGREKRAIVAQDLPFPCNLQLIIPYVSVSNV